MLRMANGNTNRTEGASRSVPCPSCESRGFISGLCLECYGDGFVSAPEPVRNLSAACGAWEHEDGTKAHDHCTGRVALPAPRDICECSCHQAPARPEPRRLSTDEAQALPDRVALLAQAPGGVIVRTDTPGVHSVEMTRLAGRIRRAGKRDGNLVHVTTLGSGSLSVTAVAR